MPNPYGAPEISVQDVAAKIENGDSFTLIDVREEHELASASIVEENVVLLPLSKLAAHQLEAIPDALHDREQEIVIFCHHGMRSAQVTAWLKQQGWNNVLSMAGGIDAYAKEIDPEIGLY